MFYRRWGFLFSTAVLQLSDAASNSSNSNDTISSDTYFYGSSPPVYPSPLGDGRSGWQDAYNKAATLVSQMTVEEKVNVSTGYTDPSNGCSGNIAPIKRLGFPGLCLSDGPSGLRGTDFVNGYPSGLHVGASWNRNLTAARGHFMAKEYRAKGANLMNAPVVGPLGRVVTGGRNWEGFTNDPFLDGQLGAATIQAAQKVGVITSTKHFIANEQELNRMPTVGAGLVEIESVSSNLDKTLHELYLWPFVDAVRAGTGSIMCSYNRVNNSHACQNSKLLNGILKTELGFQGFVLSDWGAVHAGVGSSLAGLEMEMPTGTFFGPQLLESVNNGSVPSSRLDDMATRIIATWYQMGQDQNYPARGVGIPVDVTLPHTIVDAKDPAAKSTVFQGAVEGHVLVKNTNNALPLQSPKLLSIFGYSARSPETVNPASGGDLSSASTSLGAGPINFEALGTLVSWNFGLETVNFTEYLPAYGAAILNFALGPQPPSQIASEGTLTVGGGSGSNAPAYWNSPYEALSQRAYEDNASLFWDLNNSGDTPSVTNSTDACLVFINAYATEALDRIGTHDDYSDTLVKNVASQCSNTIVVIHNAGVRLVDQFIDHPNVTAIIYGHLPGQDSGRAIVSLLYGDENFSGKLPYTVAKNESDYGDVYSHSEPTSIFSRFPQSNFSEGVYIDYRAFDAHNITPRYEFGFGLSYTTFEFSNLRINKSAVNNTGLYPIGEIQQGGAQDLWDNVATVSVDVKNTGNVKGAEVAQLYVGIPGGPVRQLRGFDKQVLEPGQSYTATFALTRRDLSV